ncbi:hypothetical protein MUP77_20425 [Candidatus Bathyarchaeota archaeon]|nr:hypothetical protein [Candidatus Bathyarchaeota archaeon]
MDAPNLDFDDIGKEEWTSSYAEGSSKMHFVLKKEKIVIETKMTRERLDAKKLARARPPGRYSQV